MRQTSNEGQGFCRAYSKLPSTCAHAAARDAAGRAEVASKTLQPGSLGKEYIRYARAWQPCNIYSGYVQSKSPACSQCMRYQ